MRVNMYKRAIYLLLPPTARIKELEPWRRRRRRPKKPGEKDRELGREPR